jgi:hypothetical protein
MSLTSRSIKGERELKDQIANSRGEWTQNADEILFALVEDEW